MKRVRELTWTADAFGATAAAFGIRSFYKMTGSTREWTLYLPGPRNYSESRHQSQAEAKHAAQADFQDRITAELVGDV